MQYRKFGRIGKISALSFGCMRLPDITINGKRTVDEEKAVPLLRKAYELGINYFDTAVGYCNWRSELTLGKAVKPFRNKVMISTKIPLYKSSKTAYFRRMLERSLRKLDTDYIDVYHFHGIDKEAFDIVILPQKMMREAARAIDEGLIRHISFSFHDNPQNMAYIIERGEIFSSVLCQYNLLDRSNEDAIANAAEKGLGVAIMGPVGGGRLGGASALSEKVAPGENMATPELALRFVLGNKNVSCALSGMNTMEMLLQNVRVASDEIPMSEKQFENVNKMLKEIEKFNELYCTGCEYCLPCPAGVEIPKIFKAYSLHNVYGLTGLARSEYKKIARGTGGGRVNASKACVECGKCAKKCPQRLDIPELLKTVQKALG
jgi:predicted aldo/keto reductase-like oxidoreductase